MTENMDGPSLKEKKFLCVYLQLLFYLAILYCFVVLFYVDSSDWMEDLLNIKQMFYYQTASKFSMSYLSEFKHV